MQSEMIDLQAAHENEVDVTTVSGRSTMEARYHHWIGFESNISYLNGNIDRRCIYKSPMCFRILPTDTSGLFCHRSTVGALDRRS